MALEWWLQPVGSGKNKREKPKRNVKVPKVKVRDRASERSKDAQFTRQVAALRSVDVSPKGTRETPRVTRSVSAEIRQRPDRETQQLMKRAEKGDTTAAAELAARWKRANG